MRWPILFLSVLLIGLTGCDTQSSLPPAPTTTPTNTPALSTTFPTAATTIVTTATLAPTNAPARVTATPNATATAMPPGMTVKDNGQSLVLANSVYYWSMKIPRDWLTTGNNGFEFDANQPGKLAFVHLVSTTWLTKDRKPNAQAYVDYWKNFIYGNVFPIVAEGALVSQTELNKDRFGGPYLRYEFDDAKNGLRYVQVYASGGGPSSVVATVWAKSADYPALKSALDAIIASVEVLKEP